MTASDQSSRPSQIAVIGGGISGLAAAHRITELLPQVELSLFESASRLGGVLETVVRDGFLVERSADNFITKFPWGLELCRRLNIDGELLPTDETKRRALVVSGGKLRRVPAGFVLMTANRVGPILTTPLLSWPGKLRLLAEPFVPRRKVTSCGDESVGSFATRRLGREAFERLVQPLLGGIHTADADQLSMAATMPEYVAQEQFHGRIQRNPRNHSESGARYGMFVAPRDGMGRLVAALAARLPAGVVRLNHTVLELAQAEGGAWRLVVAGDAGKVPEKFDAVVVALPAPVAAELLAPTDAELADALAGIGYASCSVVCLAYRNDQFARPLDGFGFVVPRIEQRKIIAGSFASEKFAGRAPAGQSYLRVFIGGALAPELADLPDDELRRIAQEELTALLQISGQPLWVDIVRRPVSMPQYHVGHLLRVAKIEDRVARLRGLELAGNAYHGVGIPQCIHSGETAAERFAKLLGGKSPHDT